MIQNKGLTRLLQRIITESKAMTTKTPKVKKGWFYLMMRPPNEKTAAIEVLVKGGVKERDIEVSGTTPMVWSDQATLEKIFAEAGIDKKYIRSADR